MDNNVIDSGGRVTRSLRKRLASVDSDSSSRPGTPISSKLTSISEISASPSRLTRITRRNSTSGAATAVKTPAKRGIGTSAIVENLEIITPTKVRTRRRSVSINENEEFPQKDLKVLTSSGEKKSGLKSTRVTRSQSKSPLLTSCDTYPGVATPAKTPAKGGASTPDIVENLEKNTPTKTHTRRQSISANENVVFSQKGLKTPTALDEQETLQSDLRTTTVTRSQSKSPLLCNSLNTSSRKKNKRPTEGENSRKGNENIKIESLKKRKPGPKSKTRFAVQLDQDFSDVEITVFGNEIEDLKNKSSNTPTIVLPNDEPAKNNNKEKNKQKVESDEFKISRPLNLAKSMTHVDGQLDEDFSDVEVSIFGNEMEGLINKSSNITTIGLTNDEPANINNEEKKQMVKRIDLEISHPLNFSKSTTRIDGLLDEKFSDVEMSAFENKIEDLKNKSSNISTIVLTNENEKSKQKVKTDDLEISPHSLSFAKEQTLNMNELQIERNNHDTEQKKSTADTSTNSNNEENKENLKIDGLEISHSLNFATEETLNVNELQIEMNNHYIEKNFTAQNIIDDLEISHRINFANVETLNMNELQIENDNNDIEEKKKNTGNNIELIKVTIDEKSNEKKSGAEKNLHIPDDNIQNKIINEQDSSKTKTELKCDEATLKKSENYLFNAEVLDYNDVHHVKLKDSTTPKTIHSFKQILSPRYDESILAGCDSLAICLDNVQNAISRTEDVVNGKVSPKHGLTYSHILELDQNSTPINMEFSKQKNLLPKKEKNIVEVKGEVLNEESSKPEISTNIISDKDNEHSPNQNKGELKWINPSVKGKTADGSKLDVGFTQYTTNVDNICDNTDNAVKQKQKKQKKFIIFSSEDEEQGNEDSYNEGEESYKRKHDFNDDEAMEAYDYESGDSMDSEEQKEIEENEIPVDGESIGNQTTDDDQDECADEECSESDDSFIVSDSASLILYQSDDEDEEVDENINKHIRENYKVTYKRIQRPADSLSTSDEEEEENKQFKDGDDDKINGHNVIFKNQNKHEKMESHNENFDENVTQPKSINQSIIAENNLLITSRENIILDSSKLSDSALRLHCTDKSESGEENNAEVRNISSKEILRKLNRSDRFNKSIRNFNPETCETIEDKYNDEKCLNDGCTSLTSPDVSANKTPNGEANSGEVSVTSESDADKENYHKSLYLSPDRKSETALCVSFGNSKNPKERQDWQRSFTIDVTVKDGELETDVKLNEPVSTSSSSTDYKENEINNKDIRYLENSTHVSLSLGNPLIRTRRQSLALPTNPDMEICSSSHVGGIDKKGNRKSLGILSSIDFKPSQSFIDSIDLQKSERNHLVPKRKRLSKSFAGASEIHDNSIVDVDVGHLHKRSKLTDENSVEESQDSTENINSSTLFTKICSTPHEKINKNNFFNTERILTRCDDILEAANLAKLEAKIRNKKNKTKTSKKQSKKKSIVIPLEETIPDDTLTTISKEIKRKDKTKTALSHAIMAADVILSKQKKLHRSKKLQEKLESKQLPPDVIEAIGKSIPIEKKSKKGIIHTQEEMKYVHTTSTSAGNFTELPQSPERKKSTYIQLPTGKVTVEPITPKKRLIKAFDGMEFRESPVTPYPIGFKVSKIAPSKNKVAPSSMVITGKRKRYNESLKDHSTRKAHWTQSGLFTEEKISKKRDKIGALKSKKRLEGRKEHNDNCNFKEKSIMRPDIKRSTNREILLLKERRHV